MKKRRIVEEDLVQKPVIIAYAECLRKVKSRLRREAKKRGRAVNNMIEEVHGNDDKEMHEEEGAKNPKNAFCL